MFPPTRPATIVIQFSVLEVCEAIFSKIEISAGSESVINCFGSAQSAKPVCLSKDVAGLFLSQIRSDTSSASMEIEILNLKALFFSFLGPFQLSRSFFSS